MNSENTSTFPEQEWDSRNMLISVPEFSNWGIQDNLLSGAKKLLTDTGELNAKSGLTFKQFSSLVSLLIDKGHDLTDLNGIIAAEIASLNDSGVSAEVIRSLQKVLQTFFSNYDSSPAYSIPADGVWGKVTQRALSQVREVFHIANDKPGEEIVSILESLSARIIRLRCRDSYLLSTTLETPLFVIDNKNPVGIEVILAGNGATLINTSSDREMVHFHSYVAADGRGKTAFLKFIRWFTLLQMPDKKRFGSSLLSLQVNQGEWTDFDELPRLTRDTFIVRKDKYLDFGGAPVDIDIKYFDEEEEEVETIALFLFGDISYYMPEPVVYKPAQSTLGQVMKLALNPSIAGKEYLNDTGAAVLPLQNADFLKIFVLRKEFQDNSWPGDGSVEDRFYQLVTLHPDDIYECHTIALSFQRTKAPEPKPFNNNWVLVAGTGDRKIPKNEEWLAAVLGNSLAENGYGLVCGGWPGVDEEVARAFTDYIRQTGQSEKDRLIQLLQAGQKPSYDYGTIETVTGDWYNEASKKVTALIMIGGKGGTLSTFNSARKFGIAVIPIASTGGDAKIAFDRMENTKGAVGWHALKKLLETHIDKRADAQRLTTGIMEVLADLYSKQEKPLMSAGEFKQIVDELYQNNKVVFSDDLQKGRWGGLSKNNGKELYAEVNTAGGHKNFNVTLMVRAVEGVELAGQAAFFLHDTFAEEKRFTRAVGGVAKIEAAAYEAFCAAAYTEDGTMLELDLNKVPGFPPGFYYEDVTDEFKIKVEQLYKDTPVQSKDDTQKNRWGKASVVNGKQLKAKVRKARESGTFTVTAEVVSAAKQPLTGDVAFFVDKSFKHQIIYKQAIGGKAEINIDAFETFTIGAYTADGTMLELDLQAQEGYPQKFYFRDEHIGKDGFYTVAGIMNLVDNYATVTDPENKPHKYLLLFSTKTQHTWLVATAYEVYILLDDKGTRKANNLIMTNFDKYQVSPIDCRVKGPVGSVKFPGQKDRWFYSLSLFPTEESLETAVQHLVGIHGVR